ncbi:MAG: four helix bundle protein [Bacteroidales bacterium]
MSKVYFDYHTNSLKMKCIIFLYKSRRAADSIALNISEESFGQSNPEFKKFIGFTIRSLVEVDTCLHKASKRNYISEEEFRENYDYAFNLMNMMVSFKAKIK